MIIIINQVTKLSSLHSWIKAQTMIRPTKLGKGGFGGEGFDDDMEVREGCDHDHVQDDSYDGQGGHDLPWWSKWPGEMGGGCHCHCDQDDEFVTIVLSSQNPISSANHVR